MTGRRALSVAFEPQCVCIGIGVIQILKFRWARYALVRAHHFSGESEKPLDPGGCQHHSARFLTGAFPGGPLTCTVGRSQGWVMMESQVDRPRRGK